MKNIMEMERQLSSFWAKSSLRRKKLSNQNGTRAIRLLSSDNITSSCVRFTFHGGQPKVLSSLSVRAYNNVFTTAATMKNKETPTETNTKGTIVGAVALIIGTSVGSGILAIPNKTSPAGYVPSATAMVVCWGFLLVECLILAEINVFLLSKKEKGKKTRNGHGGLETISIRTMAQETLGDWGGNLATANYVFLGYTTLVAYISKSGEIINHLSNIPSNISGFLFAMLFSLLLSVGGTRATDQVNQYLTTAMIVLLVAIEVAAFSSGEWSSSEVVCDWSKVPATLPAIIFTLVYHDLAPVICAYLGGDIARIRVSVILGSIVPLVVLLVWNAVALGLSSHVGQTVDPVQLLMRVRGGQLSTIVEAFSLLAVGASLIGTLLGFSQFFLEQFNHISEVSTGNRKTSCVKEESRLLSHGEGWGNAQLRFVATILVIAPPLLISTCVPDIFSIATDIAGGYCMTLLYGVLPPAMAWEMHIRASNDIATNNEEIKNSNNNINNNYYKDDKEMTLCITKPTLIGVGLFACAIVTEQIIQNFIGLNP